MTGYEPYVKEGVQLNLGQTLQLNAILKNTSYELDEIVVRSSTADVFDGNADGQKTVINENLINDVPTISRSIADFARLNPLASINEDTDGFAISLAGQNNRFNTIYFDGAVSNDAFGLADNGTNGGQTGISPISLDAIEQFTIAVAPFDIRQSGFAGGAINAITRSGTNEFKGSAYYFLRNETFAGSTPGGEDRGPLADFSAETYGFRLGGPIVEDKLFFFVNAEIQRDQTPQPFNVENYRGELDEEGIENLADFVQNNYGYDVGSYDNNVASLDGNFVLGKLDWNINEKHKLSLRHSWRTADNLEARRSTNGSIGFINGSESFQSATNSTALEINSIFSNTLSNRLVVGATIVRDDRDPLGQNFPTVFLEDGAGAGINFGAERFSTANRLDQDVITINNDFSIYKGKHNALIGVNFEYFRAANLFIRENFGYYQWFDEENQGATGVQRFLNGEPADEFSRSYSQVDNVAGDQSEAIAEFSQMLLGFYLQDEYQATSNLKITGGLRVDVPIWPTDIPLNEDFNNNAIPAIEDAGYDLRGAQTGDFISPQLLFSPRLSFNWDPTGKKQTQLRGGIGVFTSRIPLVWPGGAYNNYGLNIGEVERNNVDFIPDPQNQPVAFDDEGNPITQIDPNNVLPAGQIDLFAQDFKLPQIMKVNIALDQKLPGGFIGTIEGIYSKNINYVRYQNLQLKPSQRNLTNAGGDDRPLFNGVSAGFGDDVIDPTYSSIYLASNTDEGHSYNLVASLTKPFSNGFASMLSYSYGDAFTAFDGTSSQNSSQWRGYHNPMGRNTIIDAQRSTFAPGHRVLGQVSYELDYPIFAGLGGKSKISLNFQGQTGGYFSYVVDADNFRFVDDGGFGNNELVYVPTSQDDIPLVDLLDRDGNLVATAAEQWAILDEFISNTPGLEEHRGDYAPRNSGVMPFEFTADLRFLQDFYVESSNGKRHTFQLSVDIFNFTNLLNPEWGIVRFTPRFGNYSLIELQNNLGFPPGTTTSPEYTINPDLIEGLEPWEGNIDDSGLRSSRWQMQVGLRYIFE
jgi:outer membrane receptor for ferrienterochelin and colicin